MTNTIETKTQTATKTCQGKCPDTLCWNCRYATGKDFPKPLVLTNKKTGKKHVFHGCPWVSNGVRIPGWDAEKTVVYNQEDHGGPLPSYLVKSCPCFKDDGNKETTIEEIIDALNLPVRYALSNRTILWDYYDIYKMFTKDAQKTHGKELPLEVVLSVKVAAARAYGEDIEYELDNEEITSEEYEIKISAVNTLKETLVKYHNKVKKVAPTKK